MRYKIVSEQSIEKLTETVGDLLGEGWRPQGGITCHDYDFYQVLTHSRDTLTPSEQAEIMEGLSRAYAIPDSELNEEQRTVRQEVTDVLREAVLDLRERQKSEKGPDETN